MSHALLETKALSKRFGSLFAVDRVNLSVEKGELHALIGPNGSGKTTFFNVVTGRYKPDHGHVFLEGKDISGWPPHRLVSLGMGRCFQVASLFPQLTVFENVLVSFVSRYKRHNRLFTQARRQRDISEEAMLMLRVIEMEKLAELRAGSLSHGDKKKLDLAVALAWEPSLLLLDEPTAGLSPAETENMVDLIKRLHEQKGLAILFVEHNIGVVFSISHKITVFQMGRVIAEGKPEEVRNDRAVIEAYLGREA